MNAIGNVAECVAAFSAETESPGDGERVGGLPAPAAGVPERPEWVWRVVWCPSCLTLLPMGLRPVGTGGCCPSCGECWASAEAVPLAAYMLATRPCPPWHRGRCRCRYRNHVEVNSADDYAASMAALFKRFRKWTVTVDGTGRTIVRGGGR